MNNFNLDLSGKVAVVTGAGGVLCSDFAKAIAQCGAKVALLDINLDAASAYAKEINDNGGTAIAVKANCLEKASLEEARLEVNEKLESRHEGLYVIGDGSGITHSLSHASASGVHVARAIAKEK